MDYTLYGGDGNPQHKWTIWWMLFKKRQYVIEKIKAPLMKAIVTCANGQHSKIPLIGWVSTMVALIRIIHLCMRYPEPTKAHTRLPNTHILLDIQDKFFRYGSNPSREPLFRAIWRVLIIEYEHDPFYEDGIGFLVEEIVEAVVSGKWQPRSTEHQNRYRYWRKPEPKK